MSMRARLQGPLRMVFQAEPPVADATCPTVEASPVPIVELTVYADDSVAFGRLALSADRVTDLMNERTEFEFVDTFLQSLDDSHGLQVRTVVVARDEIFAVAVGGPRGDPARRTRTRPIPVELRVGRYDVSGNIHVVPGTDPVMGFRRRRMMVPLTEATIEFDSPDGRQHSRSGTILVNRDLTDWIGPATRSDVRPPELVPELQRSRPRQGLHPAAAGSRGVSRALAARWRHQGGKLLSARRGAGAAMTGRRAATACANNARRRAVPQAPAPPSSRSAPPPLPGRKVFN